MYGWTRVGGGEKAKAKGDAWVAGVLLRNWAGQLVGQASDSFGFGFSAFFWSDFINPSVSSHTTRFPCLLSRDNTKPFTFPPALYSKTLASKLASIFMEPGNHTLLQVVANAAKAVSSAPLSYCDFQVATD